MMPIMSIVRKSEEIERLNALEKSFLTAKKLNMNECNKCGYCCHQRTCIPTPDELVKIAEFLKLSVIDCVNKYFGIDYRQYGQYYVKPLGENIKDLGGKLIPNRRTFNEGKCVFLTKDNLCEIHPVKPKQAKVRECWKGKDAEDFMAEVHWDENTLADRFKIKVLDED